MLAECMTKELNWVESLQSLDLGPVLSYAAALGVCLEVLPAWMMLSWPDLTFLSWCLGAVPKSICRALQCRTPVHNEPGTSQLLSGDGTGDDRFLCALGEGGGTDKQNKQLCFFPRTVLCPEAASCSLEARGIGRGIFFQPDEFVLWKWGVSSVSLGIAFKVLKRPTHQ